MRLRLPKAVRFIFVLVIIALIAVLSGGVFRKKPSQVLYYGRSSDWRAYQITHWHGVLGRYGAPRPRASDFEEALSTLTGIRIGQCLALEGDGGALLLDGDTEALPVVKELLKNRESRVRLRAVEALDMIADKDRETALKLLASTSNDPDELVQQTADRIRDRICPER